jgi:hypothetical protein
MRCSKLSYAVSRHSLEYENHFCLRLFMLREMAHALALVLERAGEGDVTLPAPVFAAIRTPRIDSQSRCSGRVALAIACIGEGHGCGVSGRAATAGIDQREGYSDRGSSHRARGERCVEPRRRRSDRDRIIDAADCGTQFILERCGGECLPLGARGRDVGRR